MKDEEITKKVRRTELAELIPLKELSPVFIHTEVVTGATNPSQAFEDTISF